MHADPRASTRTDPARARTAPRAAMPAPAMLATLAVLLPLAAALLPAARLGTAPSIGSCPSGACPLYAGELSCDDGLCIPKSLGKACAAGSDCSAFTGCEGKLCVFGTEGVSCDDALDCAPRRTCVESVCVIAEEGSPCSRALNCPEEFTCGQKGVCVEGGRGDPCDVKEECLTGYVCRANRCVNKPRRRPVVESTPEPSVEPTLTPEPEPEEVEEVEEEEEGDPPSTVFRGKSKKTAEPEEECIGASSHAYGTPIAAVIAARRDLRRQHHPLRTLRSLRRLDVGARAPLTAMYCYESGASRLCATPTHVVLFRGATLHMRELCDRVACSTSMERALNFKGSCGAHVRFAEDLHATQHASAAGALAETTVRDECAFMAASPMRWLLSTL